MERLKVPEQENAIGGCGLREVASGDQTHSSRKPPAGTCGLVASVRG